MKWNLGLPYFKMELVFFSALEVELVLPCNLPQPKLELAAFPHISAIFAITAIYPLKMEPLNYHFLNIGFRIPNMELEPFQVRENFGNSVEITRK